MSSLLEPRFSPDELDKYNIGNMASVCENNVLI